MPNNWQMVDTNFPTITGEEPVKEQISKIIDYLSILTEQLQYQLQNLDASNWNASALVEMEDNAAARYDKLLTDLRGRVDAVANRVNSAEGLAGRMTEAEEILEALVLTLAPIVDHIQQKDGALIIGGEGKTVHLNGMVYINGNLQGEPEEPVDPEVPEEEEEA